jgi:hypothetical protein
MERTALHANNTLPGIGIMKTIAGNVSQNAVHSFPESDDDDG